ncbi:MAG: hypothetical protein J2P37_04905, partial [Ktedonobacteraceae bacterium]|nr:hypothetical protein [Ktedonobacteraceae bacterium]
MGASQKMSAADRLLLLISQLQRETNAIRARRLLLDHVRRSSRAQLVVLFVFDSQRDMLIRL